MSDALPDYLSMSDEEVRSTVVAEMLTEIESTADVAASLASTIAEGNGIMAQRLVQTVVRPIALHSDPRAADGFYLALHGVTAGVPVRVARAARGYATFTSATGGRVREGALLTAGGQQFAVTTSTRLPAGDDTAVPIEAQVAGDAGNVAAGATVELTDPSPDDAVARLDAQWLTHYGHAADVLTDPASLERYRRRVLIGYTIRGEAEVHARYRLAAFGVDGVSSVSVGRTPRGYGSADVAVLFDGRLPTETQLSSIRAAIDEAALGGRDVRAVAPRIVSITVRATITGTALPADVEDAIAGWFRARIGIGDAVLEQDLHAGAHAGVAGITSINYSSPSADLPARPGIWYQPTVTVTTA